MQTTTSREADQAGWRKHPAFGLLLSPAGYLTPPVVTDRQTDRRIKGVLGLEVKFHRTKLNRDSPLLTFEVSASEVRNEFVTMTAIE